MDRKPKTETQKRTLIEVYRETGNLAEAMRRAGVKSRPTAYRWLRRHEAEGEAGLLPRSSAPQKRKATIEEAHPEIAAEIARLRRLDRPGDRWGRERIARRLAELYGERAPSPAGVEAVLRRAGLWELPPDPEPPAPAAPALIQTGRPDPHALLAAAVEGVRLDTLAEQAKQAAEVLDGVWRPLETDPRLTSRLMLDRRFGGWLIRARLQLAHCLTSLGRHAEARRHLAQLAAWMEHAEGDLGFRGHPWEGTPEDRPLRWDDFWLELQQTSVDGQHPLAGLEVACARARTAIASVEARHGRTRRPANPKQSLGNLKRALASLETRRGKAKPGRILALLDEAYADLTESGDEDAMQAATLMARAELRGRLAGQLRTSDPAGRSAALGEMERDIGAALALVGPGRWPINLVDYTVSAATLQIEHDTGGLDVGTLERAARLAVEHGFAHQAARLTKLPGIDRSLSDEDLYTRLHSLARTYRKDG